MSVNDLHDTVDGGFKRLPTFLPVYLYGPLTKEAAQGEEPLSATTAPDETAEGAELDQAGIPVEIILLTEKIDKIKSYCFDHE